MSIFNDNLQNSAAKLAEAKTKEVAFDVFQKKFDFCVTTILSLILAGIAIFTLFDCWDGVMEFMKYLR